MKDDHWLAMESQDAEYARLLDEKEKERLRKHIEKHQAKKEAMVRCMHMLSLEIK